MKNSAINFSDRNAQRIENDDNGGGQIVRQREKKESELMIGKG